jgi:phospholipid/cholesterol/gamma-HCH transport system ATP-binding protein
MLKRVGLARAIVAKPSILFLDEPTTGLDPVTAEAINLLIVDLVHGMGCTAVTITPDLVSARTIADEIAMIEGGQVVWGGPVTAMLDSEHPPVQRFLRSGGLNRPAPRKG